MTIILICWLVAAILPYVWAGASVPFRNAQFGRVELGQPRVQAEQLQDGGARAWGAQQNAWEALIVFSVANAAGFAAGLEPAGTWSTLACVWVAARIGHGIFYIADLAPLRVAAFVTGVVCSVWITALAIQAS